MFQPEHLTMNHCFLVSSKSKESPRTITAQLFVWFAKGLADAPGSSNNRHNVTSKRYRGVEETRRTINNALLCLHQQKKKKDEIYSSFCRLEASKERSLCDVAEEASDSHVTLWVVRAKKKKNWNASSWTKSFILERNKLVKKTELLRHHQSRPAYYRPPR